MCHASNCAVVTHLQWHASREIFINNIKHKQGSNKHFASVGTITWSFEVVNTDDGTLATSNDTSVTTDHCCDVVGGGRAAPTGAVVGVSVPIAFAGSSAMAGGSVTGTMTRGSLEAFVAGRATIPFL